MIGTWLFLEDELCWIEDYVEDEGLRKLGWNVIVVRSPREAIEVLKASSGSIHVLSIDRKFGEQSPAGNMDLAGDSFARQLLIRWPRICKIMLTNYPEHSFSEASRFGLYEYLEKGITSVRKLHECGLKGMKESCTRTLSLELLKLSSLVEMTNYVRDSTLPTLLPPETSLDLLRQLPGGDYEFLLDDGLPIDQSVARVVVDNISYQPFLLLDRAPKLVKSDHFIDSQLLLCPLVDPNEYLESTASPALTGVFCAISRSHSLTNDDAWNLSKVADAFRNAILSLRRSEREAQIVGKLENKGAADESRQFMRQKAQTLLTKIHYYQKIVDESGNRESLKSALELENLVVDLFEGTPAATNERNQLKGEAFEVLGYLQQSVQSFKSKLGKSQIELHVETAPNWPKSGVFVEFDKPSFATTIEHLLTNATESIEESRETDRFQSVNFITIHLKTTGNSLVINVQDDGFGFQTNALPDLVFNRFYSTRNGDLRGRGLYDVRTSVEFFGGKVYARNRELRGARITIQLPVFKTGN